MMAWQRRQAQGASKQSQRGAALLAAMLTVTLVAGFAATALWQQWRAVEIESAERARVQGAWILTGSLDWARLILREDGRSGGADYLAEPWAVALQESRLSSFLAADKNNTSSDVAENQLDVFLSGQIEDMQSRLNVTNLIDANKISAPDMLAFSRLFESLGLPQAELTAMANGLLQAGNTSPESRADMSRSLMPQRLDQLQWLGLSPASLTRLKPFISLLPVRTAVNLNTAGMEVLFATIPELDMGRAQRLIDERALNHFRTLADARKLLGENTATGTSNIAERQHSVDTRFFEVRGRLRMESTVIEERSLVQRDGLDVKTLWRERAAFEKDGGAQTAAR